MLMNGKEVNHLVVNGETFDKSYFMRKIRLVKDVNTKGGMINKDGIYFDTSVSGLIMPSGTEGIVFLKYKNGYCVYSDRYRDSYDYGFWVTGDCIEFIDNDKTGGVNSPFYLLFLYCCLVLLAWEVAFLC